MEKRRAERMLTGTTVSFALPNQAPLEDVNLLVFSEMGHGGLDDLSKSGFHTAFVDPAALSQFTPGQVVGFHFRLPTGAVEGTATIEWLKAEHREIGFRFASITNKGGSENLLDYLSSAFLGVEPPR